jgi:hypothetical protein
MDDAVNKLQGLC